MRILIATPLLPPQLGGPAQYAERLGEEFKKLGHDVRTVGFGGFLVYPPGIRHALYLRELFLQGKGASAILSLDDLSVGLPAVIFSLIRRVPFVLRLEGDISWERYVERERRDITLQEFYGKPPELSVNDRIMLAVRKFVIRRAKKIAFSSEWRRRMCMNAFRIPEHKAVIVYNIFPPPNENPKFKIENSRTIVWAGRMLYLKNLYRLIRAFRHANPVRSSPVSGQHTEQIERKRLAAYDDVDSSASLTSNGVNDGTWELHLVGEGPERMRLEEFVAKEGIHGISFFKPMPREELQKKFAESAFFVLPSLSDVGPNVIAEVISAGLPFIMTKESGYAEYVKDYGFIVEPMNEEDLAEKIKMLMDGGVRKTAAERLRQFPLYREWGEAAQEWLTVFQQ